MAKAKFTNLVCGIKVLASDTNSFNVNDKGYSLIQLAKTDVSRLPKKSEIENIKCNGVFTNIEKLYCELVKYNSTTNYTKAEKRDNLENIIKIEYDICNTLGLTLREGEDGEIFRTETITINQYDFFNSCFAIKHAGKKERVENNNIIDVVTLTQFKKAVLFGLVEACTNDGEMYKLDGKHAKVFERVEKAEKKANNSKKAPVKKEVSDEEKLIQLMATMGAEKIAELVKNQTVA